MTNRRPPDEEPRPRTPEGVRVVARGAGWVAVDKPAGVLSVPGKGPGASACVASWVRERFAEARGPVTVHRLDMDTSGLLLCALDEAAQRALSGQFERRLVEKRYAAMVHGRVSAEEGIVELPLRMDPANRPVQVVDFVHGKPAATRWRVLAYGVDATRLALTPRTGRTHQLRVHCAQMGHPIFGDVLYGPDDGAGRLMLHAEYLAFSDPATGRRVEVSCPAPF